MMIHAGRNFWEVLRVLDAQQLSSFFAVGTPAHWKAPDDVFVLAHVSDETAEKVRAMFVCVGLLH